MPSNYFLARLATRACRVAARDHCDPCREDARWQINPLPAHLCKVEAIEMFDRVYEMTPDHIGTIEVTYSREGARALYGFTRAFDLILYAD